MMRTFAKQLLSPVLSAVVLTTPVPFDTAAEQATSPGPGGYSGQGAQLSTNELQQLVAPIALYPDALVAQVLGAATFPDQITEASTWLRQNKNLSGTAVIQAADAQPWDPSVKALTQFPSVLNNMASNLSWTSALGEAYQTQPSDAMSAVQGLRAKAYAAGNLKSGSQITVVQQSPHVIVIQPTDPQVVYVPAYNPTVVYGSPYVTPGYSAATVAGTGLLAFGAGVAVGAAINGGGCCGWSYSYWNCNWHGGAVVYGNSAYYGNNAWHGGYYGSGASAYGPYGSAHAGNAYNPSTGTYARGGSVSTPYGSAAAGQAYNPRTGAYGSTYQSSNANGKYGSSEVSKNGQTAYTQHQTTPQGTVGTYQSTTGAKGAAASGANGNAAVGETANGTKYAESNGNAYKNTGSGWQQTQGTSKDNSAESRGWGDQSRSDARSSSAFSGNGWQSRAESSRGAQSRGGGWGGGGRGHR